MAGPWEQYAKQPSDVQQNGNAPWQKYAAPAAAAPAATEVEPPTMLQRIGSSALDMAKGVGEGALSTLSGTDEWAREHMPAFMTNSDFGFGPPADLQHVKQMATPANTTQQIGKIGEQAGEYLLPTGVEEAGARLGGEALGRAGEVLGRMAGAGVHSGGINKSQGGSFTGGAAAGVVGSGIGQGLRKIAPKLAESALNVRGADRAYGRTPGQAILDETTGFSPRKIATQASDKVESLTNDLEDMARDSPNGASLAPARDEATKSIGTAYGRNNKSTYDKLIKMGRQLDTNLEGEEIPEETSPQQILHLKRGIGDLQTSWNPATQPKWVNGQVGRVYHALDSEFDRAVPEGAALNQRISSLMPVAQRANAEDLNAGLLQRSIGRFKAHTGALAAPLLGAGEGYREGGVPGALIGGGLGLIGTEALSSPEVWMSLARGANSPVLRKIAIPAAQGALLQAGRPSPFSDGTSR